MGGEEPRCHLEEIGPTLELYSQRLSTSKAISFTAGAIGWNPG